MSKKLAGKVAVVTGASKGIGASIARALAEEGASVVVEMTRRANKTPSVSSWRLPRARATCRRSG